MSFQPIYEAFLQAEITVKRDEHHVEGILVSQGNNGVSRK